MQTISLGLVRVPESGKPVRITQDERLRVAMMVVRTCPGFTGRTYVGLAGMNKSTPNMSGVVSVLSEPPSFGPQDSVVLPPSSGDRGNVIRPSDFWIDADVATEGVTITCFIA